jgi:murein DD-endopeptidase MepM/ murein hydrolase activator NlpD
MPTPNSYNPGSGFAFIRGYGQLAPNFYHPGQDWAAAAGTPIPAASSGVVAYSGLNGTAGGNGVRGTGYGYTVIIRLT